MHPGVVVVGNRLVKSLQAYHPAISGARDLGREIAEGFHECKEIIICGGRFLDCRFLRSLLLFSLHLVFSLHLGTIIL